MAVSNTCTLRAAHGTVTVSSGTVWGLSFSPHLLPGTKILVHHVPQMVATLFEYLVWPGAAFSCVLRSELAAARADPVGRARGRRAFACVGISWGFAVPVTVRYLLRGRRALGDASWQAQLLDTRLRLLRKGRQGLIPARQYHSLARLRRLCCRATMRSGYTLRCRACRLPGPGPRWHLPAVPWAGNGPVYQATTAGAQGEVVAA